MFMKIPPYPGVMSLKMGWVMSLKMQGHLCGKSHRAYQQLGELYQVIRLYVNFFQPSMKLVSKQRRGSRVTKKYDLAQTPYQRLVSSNVLDEEKGRGLDDYYYALDPIQLLKQLEILQDAFWQHAILETPKVRLASRRITQPESVTANLTEEQKSPEKVGIEEEVNKRKKRRYRRTGKTRAPRTWRTRKDPFEGVSEQLRQEIVSSPQRTAKSMFGELQNRYPGRFPVGQLRTLQRRVKQWRLETLVKFDVEWLHVDSGVPGSAMPGNWDGSETIVARRAPEA